MHNDAATIQCPNDSCKADNCQTDKFCKLCGLPLIKRYLWAVGEEMPAYQLGDLIADRYLLKSKRILLDTKPGLSPETPFSEISNAIKPYLRLVPYRLQVPQVYDLLPQELGRNAKETLLLEQAPIYTDTVPLEGQLMPELTSVWKEATSMRQLNWLWQIAQLWQPLSTEGVASSLLDFQLLRVEGSLMRLLQLQPDQGSTPTLSQLGQLWSQLVGSTRPSIAEFIEQLCNSLSKGEIQSAEKLVAVLDQGLTEVGLKQAHTLTISTYTDKGPSRQRNEDACYPASGTTTTVEATASSRSLAIVCDGIGGHEGGNIASNLAIEIIQQHIQQLPPGELLDPTTISNELEHSTRLANDEISQRNDNEQRHGRQRMGTTLVMSLARAHEIYITHVGDSRAYWITRTGCHQVTLDDDVAAREVRLGYAIYRDALQQASSGSLVQALGMTSASLHPTVQRFVIDEDCVFLLCSDGLSDYERVEQFWEEILPIFDGKVDVATASQRLVEIGNTHNGHDNVTVGLVYCQVKFSEPEATLKPSLVAPLSKVVDPVAASGKPANATSLFSTQLLPSQPAPVSRFLPILLGLVLLVSLGSGLITFLAKSKQGTISSPVDAQLSRTSVSPTEPQGFSAVPSLGKGVLIRTKSKIVSNRTGLRPDEAIAQPQQRVSWGIIPVGSVLQVVDKQLISAQDYWLNLQVCSTPNPPRVGGTKLQPHKNEIVPKNGNVKSHTSVSKSNLGTTNLRMLQPKDKLWIRESEIERYYLTVASLEPAWRINCPTLTETGLTQRPPEPP